MPGISLHIFSVSSQSRRLQLIMCVELVMPNLTFSYNTMHAIFEWLCYRLLFTYIYVHVYFSLLGEWRNHEWFSSAGLPIIIACVRNRVRESNNLSIAALHSIRIVSIDLVSTESQKLSTSWLYEFQTRKYLHCIRHSMIQHIDC